MNTSRHTRLPLALTALVALSGVLIACSGGDSQRDADGVESTSGDAGEDAGTSAGSTDDRDDSQPAADEGSESDDGSGSEQGTVDGQDPPDAGSGGGVMDGPADAMQMDAAATMVPEEPVPGGGFVVIEEDTDGTIEILCGSEPCQCSDGIDNDQDGVADGADSECTGPFDHDEGTFATGIPGDNSDPKWQDCFFDGNSGAGDDGCRYRTECLTGELPDDDPDCVVSEQCRDFCEPMTPPGCDCFGCCEVNAGDGETVNIIVSATCSLENLDDENACPRCEPADVCGNECGECEICLGETIDDLPDSCFPDTPPDTPPPDGAGGSATTDPPDGAGGSGSMDPPDGAGGSDTTDPPDEPTTPTDPPNVCDGGAQACLTTDDCPTGDFCSLGCCRTFFVR